jgi:hypothetical protein
MIRSTGCGHYMWSWTITGLAVPQLLIQTLQVTATTVARAGKLLGVRETTMQNAQCTKKVVISVH